MPCSQIVVGSLPISLIRPMVLLNFIGSVWYQHMLINKNHAFSLGRNQGFLLLKAAANQQVAYSSFNVRQLQTGPSCAKS